MPRFKEHLAIGQYEFIEFEADTIEELLKLKADYLEAQIGIEREKKKLEQGNVNRFNQEVRDMQVNGSPTREPTTKPSVTSENSPTSGNTSPTIHSPTVSTKNTSPEPSESSPTSVTDAK